MAFFLQPVPPPPSWFDGQWDSGEVAAVAAVLALFVTVLAALIPIFNEKINNAILQKRFSRGPYDKYTIRSATRYYIKPRCQNIDPGQEVEIRRALVAVSEPLFLNIDNFLDQTNHRHLIVLADSGMGKTSFVLNYYAFNLRRWKWWKRHQIVVVPLGRPDVVKWIDAIAQDKRPDMVIFLDALDEDTKAIENHRTRLNELLMMCQDFRHVVITCRTQFFPTDEEIPDETGIIRIGHRPAGLSSVYEFRKIYLSPLNDTEVSDYIRRRFSIVYFQKRIKASKIARKIPLLTVRPMLLAHIPDLINQDDNEWSISQLYNAMLQAWLDRESDWIKPEVLYEFSIALAQDLYKNRVVRGGEIINRIDLQVLSKKWGVEIKPQLLSTRSLLNRDAQGNLKFAHRSVLEYLYAVRVYEDPANYLYDDLTDFMQVIFSDLLAKNLYGAFVAGTYGLYAVVVRARDARVGLFLKLIGDRYNDSRFYNRERFAFFRVRRHFNRISSSQPATATVFTSILYVDSKTQGEFDTASFNRIKTLSAPLSMKALQIDEFLLSLGKMEVITLVFSIPGTFDVLEVQYSFDGRVLKIMQFGIARTFLEFWNIACHGLGTASSNTLNDKDDELLNELLGM